MPYPHCLLNQYSEANVRNPNNDESRTIGCSNRSSLDFGRSVCWNVRISALYYNVYPTCPKSERLNIIVWFSDTNFCPMTEQNRSDFGHNCIQT